MSTGLLERPALASSDDDFTPFRRLTHAERIRNERQAQREALDAIRRRHRDDDTDVDDSAVIGRGDHFDSISKAINSGSVRVRTRR